MHVEEVRSTSLPTSQKATSQMQRQEASGNRRHPLAADDGAWVFLAVAWR
jgi:hypothetical protein